MLKSRKNLRSNKKLNQKLSMKLLVNHLMTLLKAEKLRILKKVDRQKKLMVKFKQMKLKKLKFKQLKKLVMLSMPKLLTKSQTSWDSEL